MAFEPPRGPDAGSPLDAVAYLRRYRSTYTRETLDDRLRAAGHSPAAIAAAWHAVDADEHPGSGPGYLATFLAIVAGLLAILVFGGSAVLGGLGAAISAGSPSRTAIVLGLYTIAAIVAGIAMLFVIRRGRRARHAVLGVFGAVGVATITWLAISGLCLATWEGLEL
jgi:hypothetical protein